MFSAANVCLLQDDLDLLSLNGSPRRQVASPLKRRAAPVAFGAAPDQCPSPAQQYTEEALQDLFRHVHHNMPDSAKKKKLVRQVGSRSYSYYQYSGTRKFTNL